MTDDERKRAEIVAEGLTQASKAINALSNLVNSQAGQIQILQSTVCALVISHPAPKETLVPLLQQSLGRIDALVVGSSHADPQVAGMQSAKEVIEAAIEAAIARADEEGL